PQVVDVVDRQLPAQRPVVHGGQPERLPPVPGVGGQRRPYQVVGHLLRGHPEHPGQIAAQLVGTAVAGRPAGTGLERAAGHRFGQRPHQPPARRVTPVAEATGQRTVGAVAHDSPGSDRSAGPSDPSAPPAGSSGSVAPGERRTVCSRCSTVITLATASTHNATGSAHGSGTTGRSLNPAPSVTITSRSGRSMMPPSPRRPLASARALM